MKIFFSCIAFDEGKSGISDYIISVLRVMLRKHQVDLLIHNSDIPLIPIQCDNLRFVIVRDCLKKPILSMFWHLYYLPFRYKYSSYDLVFLPAGNRRLFARYPAHTVVTFHDLSQYHIPEKYDRLRMAYIKYIIPHYLKKAPIVYAISENTKNDILRYYHMLPQQILVNYNGYDPAKLETTVTEETLRSKFQISKPYLLYIARLEHPGKNHLNLIKAFEMLPDHIINGYELVLAGSPWTGAETLYSFVEKSNVKNNVIFTGFVNNEELAALYKYASLYVFPSLYEGFGIPLLEAMASSLPVLCSNRSSLPEIGGNAVLSFDPELPADIAAKIDQVLSDSTLYNKMIERGLTRVKQFSWEDHTQTILNTFIQN